MLNLGNNILLSFYCSTKMKRNILHLLTWFTGIHLTTAADSTDLNDPCNSYTALDQPWRATNSTQLNICDHYFNWNGWYRLLYYGMSIHMPESCVLSNCGTQIPLWLNGPHPQIMDGVITRQVCGTDYYYNYNYNYYYSTFSCCWWSTSIQVKACPGSYYVYKFVSPNFHSAAYCADVNTITPVTPTTTASTEEEFAIYMSNSTFDPCYNYSVLGDIWRSTSSSYSGHDDTLVEWSGWYRLYLQGSSAQIPEWCVRSSSCGGYTPLMLGGSHPLRQDGIVTRDVYGSNDGQCNYYRSNPVQVKACPGYYYVYRLVKPKNSIPMPTYCTVWKTNDATKAEQKTGLEYKHRQGDEGQVKRRSGEDSEQKTGG
ncbi:uncharacterized protein LOC143490848 [Brachyhypopomus gauderio]|uniref:uncharacterized protein LOC143490848 n=1 Tax=Brachyhypopomus gauderio TaxID=698409 RepID=UPI0040424E76